MTDQTSTWTVLDQAHRELRAPRQDLVHQALEVGRQVLHHDERHPGVGRHVVEEAFNRFQPTGRGTDPHDVGWSALDISDG